MTNEIRITLDRMNNLFVGDNRPVQLNAKQLGAKLAQYSDVEFIGVTWKVYEGASVSEQNKTFLSRMAKVAALCGREVEAFDHLNGVRYGCVLALKPQTPLVVRIREALARHYNHA